MAITLGAENPDKIFRSLRSTGVDLSEANLIRNYVSMSMQIDDQGAFDKPFLPLADAAGGATDGGLGDISGSVSRSRDHDALDGRFSATPWVFRSSLGGRPNLRAYSRLNWVGLS